MAKQSPVLGVEITGWGSALPQESFTNDELIDRFGLDSTDEWIKERTGIESRYISDENENVVSLAVEAGREALDMAGVNRPYLVDKLILATTTSYRTVPGSHPAIHRKLEIAGGASSELNTACTGFVTALIDGYRHFPVDGADRMMVIGADTLSKITDYSERGTAILFGDGAGAVVLERGRNQSGLLGWAEAVDGEAEDLLYCELGEREYIHMDGQEVFKRATRVMTEMGEKALDSAGVEVNEIALVVPHQANKRIIDYAGKKLGIDEGRMMVTIGKHGNTSSASIPLALVEAIKAGRLSRGDQMLLVGFGAGMTAAAAVIRC